MQRQLRHDRYCLIDNFLAGEHSALTLCIWSCLQIRSLPCFLASTDADGECKVAPVKTGRDRSVWDYFALHGLVAGLLEAGSLIVKWKLIMQVEDESKGGCGFEDSSRCTKSRPNALLQENCRLGNIYHAVADVACQ